MPYFRKEDLEIYQLPLTDPALVSEITSYGMDFMLGLYNGQPAFTTDIVDLMTPSDGWPHLEGGAFFIAQGQRGGTFYLDGIILKRHRKQQQPTFLIGLYNYKTNTHVFMWGHEFRAKMKL